MRSTPRLGRLVPAVLALVSVTPSLFWIALDRRVWPYDQAWYGDVSAELFGSLYLAPGSWFGEMANLMPSKPPLTSWIGQFFVPLGMAIHSLDLALLLSIVLTQLLTLLLVYGLTRRLFPGAMLPAFTALLLTASAPVFMGMSHQYLVEPLQTLVVVASFLLAARASTVSLGRLFLLLILLIVTGAAAKTTTPLYCGLAWLIVVTVAIQRLRRGERLERADARTVALAAATVVLLVFCAQWYVSNIGPMLAHFRDATSSDVAIQYGSVGSFASKVGFWLPSFGAAAFVRPWIAALAFAASLAGLWAWAWAWRRRARPTPLGLEALVVLAMSAHLAAVIVILSLQINEETRFLEPALPLFAILLALGVGALRNGLGSRLLAVLAIAQFAVVASVALGLVPRVTESAWLLPLVGGTDREVISALAEATCPETLAYRYVVIGIEYSEMNANSAAMYSARGRLTNGWRCNYTSLGYAETDAARAFARIDDLNASYVVLPVKEALPSAPNFLNLIVSPIYDLISTSNRYVREGSPIGPYQVWRRLG